MSCRHRKGARMCNRYKADREAGGDRCQAFGIRPPYEPDETYPVPGTSFRRARRRCPTAKWSSRTAPTGRSSADGVGVPTKVPSKRDPAVKLTKYVTNVRNLSSSFGGRC